MAKKKTPDFLSIAKTLKKDAIRYAAIHALSFFQDSFINQGFTDESFEAWQNRADNIGAGRNILIKSTQLQKSLEILAKSDSSIKFGSEQPYANIHNEGGTITVRVTEKMRKYFWYMYKKEKKDYYKWMALTKKDSFIIKIPKRKFVGESKTLMNQMDEWMIKNIEKRFKNL